MEYNIQAIVSAAIVALVSSGLINTLFRGGLNRLLNLISSRLDIAVKENKLSQNTAVDIVNKVTYITKKMENKFDAYVNAGTVTNENINAFLEAIKRRDEAFKKILETEFGDVE